MMRLSDEDAERFRQAVERARQLEVVDRIKTLYEDVMRAIHHRKPKCDASGRCCRFEEYRHRLFVTTLEFAAFVSEVAKVQSPWDGLGCPYQVNGLCSVHPSRPFGCRIYFCDSTAQEWQQAQYELFHDRLKRLHESLGIEYFYVEWRDGLAVLGQAIPTQNSPASGAVKLTVRPDRESK